MEDIGRGAVDRHRVVMVQSAIIGVGDPIRMRASPFLAIAVITITVTATTGDRLKVSELKEGMLLRFKEPRLYKYLRDGKTNFWLDCGQFDMRMRVRGAIGRPLMIYLGQERVGAPSQYGGYCNIRKVALEGRIAWMFPDAWRSVEAI